MKNTAQPIAIRCSRVLGGFVAAMLLVPMLMTGTADAVQDGASTAVEEIAERSTSTSANDELSRGPFKTTADEPLQCHPESCGGGDVLCPQNAPCGSGSVCALLDSCGTTVACIANRVEGDTTKLADGDTATSQKCASWCHTHRGTIPSSDPLFDARGIDLVDGAMLPYPSQSVWHQPLVAHNEWATVRLNSDGWPEVLLRANVTPGTTGAPVHGEAFHVDVKVFDKDGTLRVLHESVPVLCPSDSVDSLAYIEIALPYFDSATVFEVDVQNKYRSSRHFGDRVAATVGDVQHAGSGFEAGIGVRISQDDLTRIANDLVPQFVASLPGEIDSALEDEIGLGVNVSTNLNGPSLSVGFGDGFGVLTAGFASIDITADFGVCKYIATGPLSATATFTLSGTTVVPGTVTINTTGVTVSDTGVCDLIGDLFTIGTPEGAVLNGLLASFTPAITSEANTLLASTSFNLPAIAFDVLQAAGDSGGLAVELDAITLAPGAMVATATTTLNGDPSLFASHVPWGSSDTSSIDSTIGSGSSVSTVATSFVTLNQAVKSLLATPRDCLTVPVSNGIGAPLHDMMTSGVPVNLFGALTGTVRLTATPVIGPDPTGTHDAIVYVPGIEADVVMSGGSGLGGLFGIDAVAAIDVEAVNGVAMIELGEVTATRWTGMTTDAEENIAIDIDPGALLDLVAGGLDAQIAETLLQISPSFVGGYAASFASDSWTADYGSIDLNVIDASPVEIVLESQSGGYYHLRAVAPSTFGGEVTFEWNGTVSADFSQTDYTGSGPTFSIPIASSSPGASEHDIPVTAVSVAATSGSGCLVPPKVAHGTWSRVS